VRPFSYWAFLLTPDLALRRFGPPTQRLPERAARLRLRLNKLA
jgi:hypothetical protein